MAAVPANQMKDIGLLNGTAIAFRVWEFDVDYEQGIMVPRLL